MMHTYLRSMPAGLVMRSTGSRYLVRGDDGSLHACVAKGKLRIKGWKSTNPVAVGDRVTRGTPLLVLEAMKIEHTLTALFDGIVEEIRFQPGEQVLAEGVELVTLGAVEVEA